MTVGYWLKKALCISNLCELCIIVMFTYFSWTVSTYIHLLVFANRKKLSNNEGAKKLMYRDCIVLEKAALNSRVFIG